MNQLTALEQQAILSNPYGLQLLMNYQDQQHSHAACCLEPEDVGPWPTARWTELREMGRKIMAEDLEVWSDDLLQDFGFGEYLSSRAKGA